MIDKEEQRRRAAQFAADQLAKGVKAPEPLKWPTNPQPRKTMKTQPITAVQHALKTKLPRGLIAEPFTNELGQVINPGDQVVAVSQGYNHSVGVRLSTYIGLRKDAKGRVSSVSVRGVREVYAYGLNGQRVKYRTPGASYQRFNIEVTTSLPRKRIYKT